MQLATEFSTRLPCNGQELTKRVWPVHNHAAGCTIVKGRTDAVYEFAELSEVPLIPVRQTEICARRTWLRQTNVWIDLLRLPVWTTISPLVLPFGLPATH